MFVKVEMFDIQKCALPLLFIDFDFFANLQGRFGRFTNLALYFHTDARLASIAMYVVLTYCATKASQKKAAQIAHNEPRHERTCLCHMRTIKAQISFAA